MPVSEYTLTEQSAKRLADHLRRTEGRPEFDLRYPDPNGRWVFMCIGKAAEDIDKDTTGDVDIYRRGSSPDSELSDKGDETAAEKTVTAYARIGSVSSGSWVYLFWMGGGWEIVNAEC